MSAGTGAAPIGAGLAGRTLPLTIRSLVEEAAKQNTRAVALAAPGRTLATYGDLLAAMDNSARILQAMGIGPGDPVAMVLGNGPETAAAFLSVAAVAACAPLNPRYRVSEFEVYFSDLSPKAVIVDRDLDTPATAVARKRGIPILELSHRDDEPCCVFALRHDSASSAHPSIAAPNDTALLLHTSGTTSRPKLVRLTNANLCHSAHNIQHSFQLTAADRCLNVMPLFHVHGLAGDLLSSIAAGASVVCLPEFLAPNFFEWMAEFRPTWYTAAPTMHRAIADRAGANTASIAANRLRFIRSCSSPLPPRLMVELERIFETPVLEAYGMTEAAHQIASNPLPPRGRKPGSVGIATGTEIAIRGATGMTLQPAEIGDVVIRGPNVTPGYANDPEENAETFIDGWFRTGDRGYLDEDGYLFLSGRAKETINRGGEKISPREVDEVLLDHPAVAQAMVFALPDPRLGEEVAAAVVLRDGAAVDEQKLRAFASERLADFKIPRRIVFVSEIPKGPTGKPQRMGAAAKLGVIAPETGAEAFVPPRNSTESLICEIWRQILALPRVGVHDNFWHIGGDSLLATRMLARLQDARGAEAPLVVFFDEATPARLAAWIESSNASAPNARPLSSIPRPVSEALPLSFAQERMWFLAQLEGDAAPYVRVAGYRLYGPLDIAAMERSLNFIVERHEVLRTTYHNRKGVVVQVVDAARSLSLDVTDLSEMEKPARIVRLQLLAREQVNRPFDLSGDLMLRASIVRLGAEEHCLLIAMHHIASDGWSSGVLLRELRALYEAITAGTPVSLPALPAQYANYAIWRRSHADPAELEAGLSYWTQQLSGLSALLRLPTDRPRPVRHTFRGGRESLVLAVDLTGALEELSCNSNATIFMTLLAAFQVLLYRYTGSEDIAVGCPVANRPHSEMEDLIGLFVNTIVLRTDLSGTPSFRELLARVRQNAIAGYAHQWTPFEKVVEALQPMRSLSYAPFFQVMFQLRNLGPVVSRIGEMRVEPLDFDPGTAQFDFTLDVQPLDGSLGCVLEYNTDLFDASTAQRMLANYRTLLEGIVANPAETVGKLPILTEAERRGLIVKGNQTAKDFLRQRLSECFERQEEKTPDALAVMFEGSRLTYREINRRANQLAHHLKGLGVGPDTLVGFCFERSPDMVVALLGVLKAGCAYVPLDPAFPQDRLAFMVEDSGMQVLATHRELDKRLLARPPVLVHLDLHAELIAQRSADNPKLLEASPGDLAYVLYTSGSTGQPKGVEIPHSALVNFLLSMQSKPGFSATDRLLAVTTLSFDIAGLEIYLPLISGGSVVIASTDDARDPARLMQLMRESGCNVMQATPALWRVLVDAGWSGSDKLKILCGGEALPVDLVKKLLPRCAELWNMYGPTETTIWSAVHRITSAEVPVSIGRPIANTQIYLLDANRNLVPKGAAGELCIGGAGLARGYLRRPELTRERFIQNPFQRHARLYRTGDLARWLPNGGLEYLGRIDDQLKIRGYRVEPAEVEAALERHPSVGAAVVDARGNEHANRRLIAWIVTRGEEDLDAPGLRRHLRERLPDYMVPSQFVFLPSLPLLPNGKVDRRSLPEPIRESLAPAAPARNESERRLLSIWRELLSMDVIGVHDNFFDLGGHSLLMARMAARIEEEFGFMIAFSNLFESPTVAELAQLIHGHRTSSYPRRVMPLRPEGSAQPFFCFGAGVAFRQIAQRLDPEQPVFGIAFEESEAEQVEQLGTFEKLSAELVRSLREYQPNGPYYVGGYSLHGLYAYEAARQLRSEGQEVALLVLFDTFLPLSKRPRIGLLKAYLSFLFSRAGDSTRKAAFHRILELCRMLPNAIRPVFEMPSPKQQSVQGQTGASPLLSVPQLLSAAKINYVPGHYDGVVTFIEAASQPVAREVGARFGWDRVASGGIDVRTIPGEHLSIVEGPCGDALATELNQCLRAARQKGWAGNEPPGLSRAATK